MKIAFVSTRGIPNSYGGFEQFAEQISVRLVARGHEVVVYSPHYHAYRADEYHGVRVKHIYSPERWMGSSAGSFVYDFLSFRDALKRERPDIIYVAGYTSIVPAYLWYNAKRIRRPAVVTNMDGLEYKRTKFGRRVQAFLAWEERMTVRHCRHLVADNAGIQEYYRSKYGRETTLLAYGAEIPTGYDVGHLREWGLTAGGYFLIVARMEPENNITMAVEGYLASKWRGRRPLVVVGKPTTPHGRSLLARYGGEESVRFVGGVYDADKLNALRHFACAYFHGHSVGGTNPSLLEAMACGCFIMAHGNAFNRTVLGPNAFYYTDARGVASLLDGIDGCLARKDDFTDGNLRAIRDHYSWDRLAEAHERFFREVAAQP